MHKFPGVKTAALGFLLLTGAIILRSFVVENIHPWQFEWVIWVTSTNITAGLVGWGFNDIWQRIKENRNGPSV